MGKLAKVERAKDCTHPFVHLDSHNLGTCRFCGAELQYYPEEKKPPQLVKPGISLTSGDPKQLPVSIKRQIAQAAKEHGIAYALEKFGIKMEVVRAWVGAYTRDKSKHQRGKEPVPAEGIEEISIVEVVQGECLICGVNLDSHYCISKGNHKASVCGNCAPGVEDLFRILEIPFAGSVRREKRDDNL